MAVITVVDGTDAGDAEVASDVLWSLGVDAVEERRPAPGRTELWTSVGDHDDGLERLTGALAGRWPWRLERVDESVADTWRQYAVPVFVTDTVAVVPQWWEGALGDGVDAVWIEPGGAFGLGDHPTTLLTARVLLDVLGVGHTVLDVGCGTGVLGILALRHGARSVVAVDIADTAVVATRHNAALNDVTGRLSVSLDPLESLDAVFDVVLANILAPALISLAPELRRLTAPGGRLVISGVLAERHDHVLAALSPMIAVQRVDELPWSAVVLAHQPLS